MLEQDVATRSIKEAVRTMFKMLFNVDTEEPEVDLLDEVEERKTMDELFDMIDEGYINEAENQMYELTEYGTGEELEMALLFYSHLNEKSDEFLEQNEYCREEVKLGLKELVSRYGMGVVAEMFL